MDIQIVIIILLLVGAALALIIYPLIRFKATFQTHRSGQTLQEYETRYQAALTAIKDLMFDYEMGKIFPSDYEMLLDKTKREAAQIRHQIDQLSLAGEVDIDPDSAAKIERLIAQQRDSHLNGNEQLQQEVSAEIALLQKFSLSKSGNLACPHCGTFFEIGDTFCIECGQSLATIEVNSEADVCAECGYISQSGDAFCPKCGVALSKNIASQSYEEPSL